MRTYTPDYTEECQSVQPLGRYCGKMRVYSVVNIIDCRKNAPDPINLRPIPVCLRNYEKQREECTGEEES